MQLKHPDGRFWVGRQQASQVFARWGTSTKVQERTSKFKTPALAARELAGLVKKLEALGYVADFPRSLLESLAANPRDEAALAVLGDALLATGDARGELAALTVQRRASELGKFLVSNAARLFGPALDDADRGFLDELTWSPGFLYGATVHEQVAGEPDERPLPDSVRRLFEAPVAALLRELVLSGSTGESWTEVARVLQTAPNVELLSVLRLRTESDFGEFEPSDLSDLWPHLPNLRALELGGAALNVGRLDLPQLRELSRTGGGFTPADAAALAASPLPQLERLELGFEAESTADTDALVVHCLQRPTVRHLALRSLTLSERLIEKLLDSGALERLESLDLGDCVVDEAEAAELLRDSRKALLKLERLTSPTWPPDDEAYREVDDEPELGEPVLEGLRNLVDDAWAERAS